MLFKYFNNKKMDQQNEEQNEQSQKAEQTEAQQTGEYSQSPKQESNKDDKLWAVLSYLGVLCLIPLLVKKESEFVQFHAKQGLIILIGWVISWFPVLGWIIGILMFVFSIMGIMQVLSMKKEKLPIVGDLAEKINI